MIKTLTQTELRTLRLLSTGATTQFIAIALNVTPGRVQALYVYIRDKTGIKDLFKKSEVLAYMESRRPKRAKKPTPMQIQCLRMYINDWSYEDISKALNLATHQSAQNHVSLACKRMGIEMKHHEEYLSTFHISWRHRRRELIEDFLQTMDHTAALKSAVIPLSAKKLPLPDVLPEMQPDYSGNLNGDPSL